MTDEGLIMEACLRLRHQWSPSQGCLDRRGTSGRESRAEARCDCRGIPGTPGEFNGRSQASPDHLGAEAPGRAGFSGGFAGAVRLQHTGGDHYGVPEGQALLA